MSQSAVPQGGMSHAQFDYGATPSVFFGRTGWGPLIVCLDTNLLIHLAQNHDEIGGSFGFDGQGFCPELWDDPVRALHDLFLLWFWRDVRFFLPPEQMKDGRSRTVPQEHLGCIRPRLLGARGLLSLVPRRRRNCRGRPRPRHSGRVASIL